MQSGIIATVGSVSPDGPSGPYATAVAKGVDGTITFSLHPPTWNGTMAPPPGAAVFLSDIYMHRVGNVEKGWRALSARLATPEDLQTFKSSELQT